MLTISESTVMDTGDSNFSEQPSSFILLPSQDETQQESQEEAQMRHILTTLPGLQPPGVQTLSKLIDVGETSAEESKTGPSKVIVADSEVETHHKVGDMIETSDLATVSESVDDSADNADVTVVEKKTTDDSDMIADTEISASSAAEPTSPAQPASPVEPDHSGHEDVLTDDKSRSRSSSPNESSFQSKDRSNLGSYDQCELYGTQRGHAHGQRFQQVQSSQDDVFEDNDNDNGAGYVSTPAEHIGSLQLSLKPMLVPETVDEMESEVPLSPPFMIPASPTDQEQTEEDTVYNVNEANTLADSTKSFNYSGSSSSSKGSGDRTMIERQPQPSSDQHHIGDVIPTEEQDFMMRPGPTMAGEVIQQASEQPESLHLHFSESHPSGSSDAQQQMESPERSTESPEIIQHTESPEIIEYVTETPKKRPPTEQVSSSQNRDISAVNQSEARIIRIATPKMKAPPTLPRELTKTPEDVIIIDSGSVNVLDEEEEEQLSLHLSPSQGEVTQSNKRKQMAHSQKSAKDTMEANMAASVTAGTSKSSSGDRFSDDFHLSLPKGGDLLHPVSEKGVAVETRDSTSTDSRQLSASGKLKESETFTEPSVEHPKSPTLTMSMIQTDSEAVPEHVFRLEKPELRPADTEAASEENQQEDIFRRAKVKQARKHWQYIQEEDSDDDEYISPRQLQGITSSLPRSALPTTVTAEESKTAENSVKQVDCFAEQQEEPQSVSQHHESNEYTLSYDPEAAVLESSNVKINGKANFTEQVTEMEVLEAVPLEMTEVQPADSVGLSEANQEQSEIMRPPSTPVMSQDKTNGQDRPKTPAHVQNILKAYSDIIYKKTPLRQRSASVDISQLPGSAIKTSLARQFSHEPSMPQSHSLSQLQNKDIQSGKLSQLVIPPQASFSNGASVSKGGSVSPKGGSSSPKGESWKSAKTSKESVTDKVSKQKKSGETSPNSNPPKSPKGIDIADISHELLESFRQSKRSKHRHHSGSHTSLKRKQADQTNGSVKHSDHTSVQINGENITRSLTSAGSMTNKDVLSSPPSKTLSTSRTTESCSVTMSPVHVGTENQNLISGIPTPGQGQNRTSLPEANTVITVQKSSAAVTPSVSKSTRKAEKLKKSKKLMSSAERMRRRSSVDSNISAQITTGSFVSSTQRFLQKETSIEPQSTTASGTQDTSRVQGHDPFSFQGSQSQTSHREMRSAPRLKKYTSSSFERTPVSTRKRKKVIYKKSGVKKQKLADEAGNPSPVKQADKFQKATSPVSLSSDITVTTIGSLQSIPSSISHASPVGEPVLSPSSSGSKASTGGGGTTQRRLSIEPLPDTLQLQSEDDNYQRVTVVTTVMERYIKETVTKREVIGSQGQVLESKETVVQKGEPVIVDEKTHKKVQLIYVPSPSRSVSSLTSGDLADISSSMSRSYSSSLGSKVSTTGGSFDQSQKSPDHSEAPQRTQAHQEPEKSSQKEAGKSQNDRRLSEFLEPQPSTSKMPYELLKKDTLKKQKPTTPDDSSKSPFTGVTPIIPPTAIVPSDTDGSDVGTPLGSTINKTGSCLHSRSVSLESPRPVEAAKNKSDPKASDSLFSSLEDKGDNQEGIQTRRRSSGTSDGSLIPAGQKRQNVAVPVTDTQKPKTSSGETSDQISPEIPYQDQAVSSSGSIENTALIPSTGEPGSRVIAKWKDGFFYPGTVKGKDRYGRFQVKFDDGDSMTIKNQELLLVERLPVGQSVLVQTKDGDFESGMILEQKESDYTVETDMGSKGSYLPSQVILTGDQASCLICDKGKEIMLELPSQLPPPANVGDVSLENLVDTPRRSATKAPRPGSKVKEEGQGQGGKTKKRKLEALQPQATSTPTPNRKHDTASPKKRKTATEGIKESPLVGVTSSPVSTRKSPRKARVGLFTGDLGPIPTKKLFRGMLFLLTNVDKSVEQRKQEKELLQDSSLETSTGESASEEEVAEPFDKNHLKSQIEAGGGKVLDNFDVEQIESSKKCYLLSSTYQRTIKYFQCLACGVPCVAHSWVIHSCTQDRLLDHKAYILPAGISLEKKKLIEWKTRTDVLIGVKAYVSSKDAKFCECWSEMLRLCKCTVLPKLQYSELDVIVTDSNCTQTVVRQAANHSVPLVSTEWVIQSLINGKQMKYDGHPRYQHDFMI